MQIIECKLKIKEGKWNKKYLMKNVKWKYWMNERKKRKEKK